MAAYITANEYYLGFGSNLGARRQAITNALREMARNSQIAIKAVSPVYESAPWGPADQPAFLNCAAQIISTLTPFELLAFIKYLEKKSGRVHTRRWGERTLDIDILCGSITLQTPALTIPHPRMHERAFVLVPLADLNCAYTINSVSTRAISSTLRSCGERMLWRA